MTGLRDVRKTSKIARFHAVCKTYIKKAFSPQVFPEDEDAFLVVVCGSANSWIWIIDNKIRYENN